MTKKVKFFPPAYTGLDPILLEMPDAAAQALVDANVAAFPVALPIAGSGTPTPTPGPTSFSTDGLVASFLASSIAGVANGAKIASWSSTTGSDVATQSDASKQPTFLAAGVGGRPAVRCDGSAVLAMLSTGPAAAALASGTATVLVFFQAVRGSTYGTAFSYGGYNDWNVVAGESGQVIGGAGWAIPYGALTSMFSGILQGEQNDGPGCRSICNGSVTAITNGRGGSGAPMLGGNPGWGGVNADIAAVLVYNTALRQPAINQNSRWFHELHGLQTPFQQFGRFFMLDSDSIGNGLNGSISASGNLMARIAAKNGWPLGTWSYCGISGRNMATIQSQAPQRMDGLTAVMGSTPWYAVLYEYANQYSSNPADLTAINTSKATIAGRKAAGAGKVVFITSTDISTSEGAGYSPAHRNAYNAYDWSGAGGADVVIPLHTSASIGVQGAAPASPPNAKFSDSKHLTESGYDDQATFCAPYALTA